MSRKIKFNSKTDPDEFKAIRLIGSGGYGQVIELLHIPTGKHFAGKIIRKSKHSSKNIKNEISIMKSVKDKNIIHFYGTIKYPRENPHRIVVMDYCDRGSLRDILKNNHITLNEDQISIILHDLLRALSTFHTKYQTVHGDIKAANILISSDGSVRLTDFGLSHKLENSESIDTSFSGSPYWMSPEVILCENYSFPADIWSVGATAYELIEGEPPFYEYPTSRAMNEIVSLGFPGFHPNTKVSSQFNDFIMKCFRIRPNQRPTADELLKHPFIKRARKLDRNVVLKELLLKEINFDHLMETDECKNLQKFIHFENQFKTKSLIESDISKDSLDDKNKIEKKISNIDTN